MQDLFDKYSGVIHLNSKDFDLTTKHIKNKEFEKKVGLVLFYVNWCPSCRDLAKYLIDISLEFKNKCAVGVVNCDDRDCGEICSFAKLTSYPTIKFIHSNKMYPYTEKVNREDLIFFISTKTDPN